MPPDQAAAHGNQPPAELHDRDRRGEAADPGARRASGMRRPLEQMTEIGQRVARAAEMISIDAHGRYNGATPGGFQPGAGQRTPGRRTRSMAATR